MRNSGRLKLGYYPLPIEEAENIHALLFASGPYAAIDSCVGDGTALLEITKNTDVHLAGIELDADRAAAAAQKGIATKKNDETHGIIRKSSDSGPALVAGYEGSAAAGLGRRCIPSGPGYGPVPSTGDGGVDDGLA